jgi:hypothetical protein
MPFGNGRGPDNAGPMTGRGAGFCAGYNVPGYANPMGGYGGRFGYGFGGRGRGHGRGRGMGYRFGMGSMPWNPSVNHPYQRPMAPDEEKAFLKNQVAYLQDELNALNDRIQELEQTHE